VYAGRWARARGILGVLFSAAVLVPVFVGSSARRPQSIAVNGASTSVRSTAQLDDSTVVMLILLFVALLGFYLVWLVAGHRTIHGSRSAASVVFVLSVLDLVVTVVLLAFSATSVGSALLGSVLSVVIIALLMDRESAAWRKGR
jgi:hypothetical protein